MADNTDTSDLSYDCQRSPYAVRIGKTFSDYKEDLARQLALMMTPEGRLIVNNGEPDADALSRAQELIKLNDDASDKLSEHQYTIPTMADSSIFGNDAMNPYAGFCRDDDIVHQEYTVTLRGVESHYGMGRVYHEIYDSKQQLVSFQFGIPRYRSLSNYMKKAVDNDMADLNMENEKSMVAKMCDLVTSGLVLAIKLPFLPVEWMGKVWSELGETEVTEYFWFKETMPTYLSMVNTILAEVGVSLGIVPNADVSNDQTEIPEVLRRTGPDIYSIINTRYARLTKGKYRQTHDLLSNDDTKATNVPNNENPDISLWGKFYEGIRNWFKEAGNGLGTSIFDQDKFITLRLEKGSDNASETFSNSVQPSALQQKLNGMVNTVRSMREGAGQQGNNGIVGGLTRVAQRAKSWADKVTGVFGKIEGLQEAILYTDVGNGYFDLPQQWAGSTFSRSVSINFRFRAKTGGDAVSVYTSILIPLACLIAGAIPRASGESTYQSPFILRAWSKGMFAIPAGIINTLTISRGDAEFGWSQQRLPTVVNANVSITDLSPILFMNVNGTSFTHAWSTIFRNNSKLHEYLSTLSAVGIRDRYFRLKQIQRRAQVAMWMTKSTVMSGTYWGYRLGSSRFGKLINAFTPSKYIRTPTNQN